MNPLVQRTLWAAAAALGILAGTQAVASTVITFDESALTGVYFPGESFVSQGYRMTVDFDVGVVDGNQALGAAAPSGNSSQYYIQTNDGGLLLERVDGGIFSLDGFAAAYVPVLGVTPTQTTVIVAFGRDVTNAPVAGAWFFGDISSGSYPFLTYDDPADLVDFQKLQWVEFFACSLDNAGLCQSPTNNGGQFALDDIALTEVPEPQTFALLVGALLSAGLFTRRARDGR